MRLWPDSRAAVYLLLVVGSAGMAGILTEFVTDSARSNDVSSWLFLGAVALMFVVATFELSPARVSRSARRAERDTDRAVRPTLAERIEDVRANLSQSSAIIAEINAEVELQTTTLERIRAEAEQNRRLAALHQDEADAVRELVEATLRRTQTQSAMLSSRQQWGFFFGGLLFSIPMGIAGNLLYDLVTR
ncbi:MAG: hypothetical protein ACRDTF_03515 [Pseudonocardiaceae bacterium]